jgi:hypothetical protein
VNEKLALTDEKSPGAPDVKVIERLFRIRHETRALENVAEVSDGVAGIELAGLHPAEARSPEPVVDAGDHRLAIGEHDPQGSIGRIAVHKHNGLVAERPGGRVLAQHLIADLDRFDRSGSVCDVDRRAGGEASSDLGGLVLGRGIFAERRFGRCFMFVAEIISPPDVPGVLGIVQVVSSRPSSHRRAAAVLLNASSTGLAIQHLGGVNPKM